MCGIMWAYFNDARKLMLAVEKISIFKTLEFEPLYNLETLFENVYGCSQTKIN